jgi:hypothetical protein
MNASAWVFERRRVPLFAQTPVVGIPLSTPPLEDPLLEDPLPEDPPLEELLLEGPPLEELLPLEELPPLEEPAPGEPLPLAVSPLEDPPPEELPPPGEPLLPAELVPLEEPAPDKPASMTMGGLKSMLEVPEQPEARKNVTAGNPLSLALLIPLDFKQLTSLSSAASRPARLPPIRMRKARAVPSPCVTRRPRVLQESPWIGRVVT